MEADLTSIKNMQERMQVYDNEFLIDNQAADGRSLCRVNKFKVNKLNKRGLSDIGQKGQAVIDEFKIQNRITGHETGYELKALRKFTRLDRSAAKVHHQTHVTIGEHKRSQSKQSIKFRSISKC